MSSHRNGLSTGLTLVRGRQPSRTRRVASIPRNTEQPVKGELLLTVLIISHGNHYITTRQFVSCPNKQCLLVSDFGHKQNTCETVDASWPETWSIITFWSVFESWNSEFQITENPHVTSRFPLRRVLPRSDWLTRPDQSREFPRHDGEVAPLRTHCGPYRGRTKFKKSDILAALGWMDSRLRCLGDIYLMPCVFDLLFAVMQRNIHALIYNRRGLGAWK